MYQIWCQSVQPFDRFPKHLNLWPPKKPWNAPGVLWGELYLAYVHSQTNPPTCTKFGSNRCSRLTASQYFWICDLVPPLPKWPLGYWGATWIYPRCPFPDESADVNQSWCQSVQPFDSFPRLLNVWPLTPPPQVSPLVSRGAICLAYIHSQIYLQRCAKFGAYRSSRLTASQYFWICVTLTSPRNAPWGIEGRLVFSLCTFTDESAEVNQSWCQSDSFPRLLNSWPLKTPQVPPCVSRGNLFGVYPFPYEFAHEFQIWCQSAQPFGSFPEFALSLVRLFAAARADSRKNTPKSNIYTSKIIIPARTCRHQRH